MGVMGSIPLKGIFRTKLLGSSFGLPDKIRFISLL